MRPKQSSPENLKRIRRAGDSFFFFFFFSNKKNIRNGIHCSMYLGQENIQIPHIEVAEKASLTKKNIL